MTLEDQKEIVMAGEKAQWCLCESKSLDEWHGVGKDHVYNFDVLIYRIPIEPPKAREWFIASSHNVEGWAHPLRENAEKYGPEPMVIIHVREVVPAPQAPAPLRRWWIRMPLNANEGWAHISEESAKEASMGITGAPTNGRIVRVVEDNFENQKP